MAQPQYLLEIPGLLREILDALHRIEAKLGAPVPPGAFPTLADVILPSYIPGYVTLKDLSVSSIAFPTLTMPAVKAVKTYPVTTHPTPGQSKTVTFSGAARWLIVDNLTDIFPPGANMYVSFDGGSSWKTLRPGDWRGFLVGELPEGLKEIQVKGDLASMSLEVTAGEV
ncbi:MAG: hypothetical protein QW587_04965 [Candidatus Bathyarchaeia archaeon]